MECRIAAAGILSCFLSSCSGDSVPARPSTTALYSPSVISLEGEPGSGEGHVVQRSRASGGLTLHLGPGEQRLWTSDVRAAQVSYRVAVTYSNGKEGENEVI